MKLKKKEKKNESSTSEDVKFCLGNSYGITSQASSISTSTTNISLASGSNSIWVSGSYENDIHKKVIHKILDRKLVLESLVDKNLTETYEIIEMKFEKSQSKITCNRKIDLSYLGELESHNQLLLEFMPVSESKPLNGSTYWINNDFTYVRNPSIIGGTGTITVNPNYWTGTITTNTFQWNGTDNTIRGLSYTASNSVAVTV